MKSKILCLLILTTLTGCNSSKEPMVYTCGSPVGTFQVMESEGIKVTVVNNILKAEDATKDIVISFVNCIGIRSKE